MSAEPVKYWIARTVVLLAGVWIIVIAAVIPTMMSAPEQVRLWGRALGLPLGALMLCPNRLTVAGLLFKCRLAASILVGLILIGAGFAAIAVVFDAEHDPKSMVLVAPACLLVGFCLPGCLWWRSSSAAKERDGKYQEV
jgi:hypothetical protein